MSVIALSIPGEYVDAYIYADRLLAWNRSGAIVTWSMRELSAAISEDGAIPRWLIYAAFDDNRQFDDPQRERVVGDEFVRVHAPPTVLVETGLPGIAVYDILVTHFRIFVSTSEGLFSLPLGHGKYGTTPQTAPTERMPGRILAADYHFGSIVAAAGKRGTWALVNEFGFSFETPRRVEQFTDGSAARAGWFGHTLYEIDDLGEHRFYSAVLREGSQRPGAKYRNPRVVVGVREYSDDAVVLPVLSEQLGTPVVSARRGHRLFPLNSSLVRWVDGQLWLSPVGRWLGDFVQRGEMAVIADHVTDVWDIAETSGGFAVETERGVFGIEGGRYLEIEPRPVISMRTYPDSRRYRRIVTTTSSAGLTVSCMTGDHPYPRELWWRSEDELEDTREEEHWGGLKGLRVAPPGAPGL